MNRRQWLIIGAKGLAVAWWCAVGAEAAPVKPMTTASLTRSLLGLMDKARAAGMDWEAEVCREAAEKVLRGGQGKGRARVKPCTTDTDCQRKNGGDGYGSR